MNSLRQLMGGMGGGGGAAPGAVSTPSSPGIFKLWCRHIQRMRAPFLGMCLLWLINSVMTGYESDR